MRFLMTIAFASFAFVANAADISVVTDASTGFAVYTLVDGTTQVKCAPAAGANVYSVRVDGTEFFRQPDTLDTLPGVGFGNPVLYPTPNRVKDARFTFASNAYEFPANAGKNFIHGLVNRISWEVVSASANSAEASLRCLASFAEGTALYEKFPFSHRLYLTVTVASRVVRWQYEVVHTGGDKPVPFGFALHPYFVYQGSRQETYLTIPATHWMQSENKLPSGVLVPASELKYQLGSPISLASVNLDDVFFGMNARRPTVIDFRSVNRRVTIRASNEFSHLVVWTPDRPYFGVESQTCSTDAHNLHAAGHTEAAHLQICPVGETMSGWVEYRFSSGPQVPRP